MSNFVISIQAVLHVWLSVFGYHDGLFYWSSSKKLRIQAMFYFVTHTELKMQSLILIDVAIATRGAVGQSNVYYIDEIYVIAF